MEYSFTLTYLFNNEIKTISSEKFLFENDELLDYDESYTPNIFNDSENKMILRGMFWN